MCHQFFIKTIYFYCLWKHSKWKKESELPVVEHLRIEVSRSELFPLKRLSPLLKRKCLSITNPIKYKPGKKIITWDTAFQKDDRSEQGTVKSSYRLMNGRG